MVSLELRETLISDEKIGSDTETTDRILDLESGGIDELNKPVPGMWLPHTNPTHCCIYRVPDSIRQVNPEAYTPQLVIIGPLHHSLKSQALKSRGDITNRKLMGYLNMERHKKFYLTEFAQRLKGQQTIDELRRKIEEEEDMIRASYSESTAWIESPEFIDMILHDSVFIIEFIFRIYENELLRRNILMEPSLAEDSYGGASHAEASLAEDSHGGIFSMEASYKGAFHGGGSHAEDHAEASSHGGASHAEASHAEASSHGGASHAEASHAEASSHGGFFYAESSHAEASYEGASIRGRITREVSIGQTFHWRSFMFGKLFMGEPLMDVPCLYSTVVNDLILLENQLPYVILEKLSDRIVSKLFPGKTFRKLVIGVFLDEGEISDNSEFTHFTDLIRLVHVETLPNVCQKVYDKPIEHIEHTYTASKLDSGGVEFEAVKENFSLNVRFENGCLKMTCLKVEDKVEMRLRNIMAHEQCHYPYHTHVCNYVNFLDCLIDTHKDVELLVEKGIIKNWIGQDGNVAEMVNKLCFGIMVYSSYYSDIADEVNVYYNNPINRSRTLLKRVYFGNLWTGTATLAATFLLVMTLIQTVASIIQTKN